MPIFEYRCESCESKFEKLVRRADEHVECPSCGTSKLEMQYSTFAAQTNGSSDSMPSCPSGMCQNPGMCGRN
ncbi:MAG TPA: zinc ribbon domain-containing protein [Bryobacteraceae bacterium]